jgi:hypothetical protein
VGRSANIAPKGLAHGPSCAYSGAVARWTAFACLLASTAPAGRAAERVGQILGKVEQSHRSAKSFRFVGSDHSGWRMHLDPAHEDRVAWDSVGTGRLWIGRYQAIACQASQAHIAGRGKVRLQGRTANCVVIETGEPAAGSIHRYWADEASYLIVRERVEIRSRSGKSVWSGRGDLNARPPAPKAGALPGCATPRHST